MNNAQRLLMQNFDQLVAELQNVVAFNTEKSAPTPNAPFGTEIRKCLDYVINLSQSFSLDTYDCDGYACHVDYKGTGNQVLGILGHLDVVPAKASEWKHNPFGGVIDNNKLYGRGTMDDKGPMLACLFAVKALKDSGFVPSKTIRLIFGCDEESGMECVEHYFAKMPKPDVSFSPDGDFPVINREKGIYQFDIICGKLPQGVTVTAGDRANVVPSLCQVTTPNGNFETTGISAHGSTPDKGDNATHKALKKLIDLYPDNATLRFVYNNVCDITGKRWGIDLTDEPSGKLTCNLGVIRTLDDGTLKVTVDIRFPVTYNCTEMYNLLRRCTPAEYEIVPAHTSEPLFVEGNSELVTTLMDIYNTTLGVHTEPLAIGGGTYSRCLPNCVAFGPLFPDEEQTIHMPNECVDLDNLKLMAQLYLEAIYRLSK